MKGVPVRLELGPRDLAAQQAVVARRDQPGRDSKQAVPLADIGTRVRGLLDDVQEALYQRALGFREQNSHRPASYQEMQETLDESGGFHYAGWCGSAACEQEIKADTQATIRVIPFDQPDHLGLCIKCGEAAAEEVVFAKAY